MSQEERKRLEQFSRSLTIPADQVIHAKEVLVAADGHTFTDAARLAGRKSGDAVAHLIAHFNREGLSALETRHGGGPPICYTQVERECILKEFRRAQDSQTRWHRHLVTHNTPAGSVAKNLKLIKTMAVIVVEVILPKKKSALFTCFVERRFSSIHRFDEL